MRLVVNLKKVEKVVVDGVKRIYNTKTFEVKNEDEGKLVLASLEASGMVIGSHNYCGDTRSWGRPFKNRSKKK